MAFCVIEEAHIESLTKLVFQRIRKNPSSLKNFKDFSQEIFQFLVSKGQTIERAITLVKYLPQAVSEFNANPEDRKTLRSAGVSMDAIYDVEDQFKEYKQIAKYLGLKEEGTPIVIVNQNQLNQQDKITKHVEATNVTFDENVRSINGKKYETRVTSIAKVGFENKNDPDQQPSTPALKHGNTVDTIAKAIFDDINPQFKDFQDLIEEQAFEMLVSRLKTVKSTLQQQGFVFKTGVTVYDKNLGISGEIDLVAISPEGNSYIMDFKTANQRFNETYLKNNKLTFKSDTAKHEMKILSKWQQYGTQGYIYARMLEDQLGIVPIARTGIIGINISYDPLSSSETSKIEKVVDIEIHNIPFTEVRPEMKGKTVSEMNDEYKRLKDTELGPITEVKQKRELPNRGRRQSLDRTAILNEAAASYAELKADIDWFNSNPIGKDTLLRFMDYIGAGVLGRWTLDAITIAKGAPRGTIQHEAWHRFSQVFMSPEQRDNLYKSVQKDNLKFRTRDGRNVTSTNASWLDIEEFLADEFAKYALNPNEYKYPTDNKEPKTLFEKIWAFLKRFFMGKNPRPIELFNKLYTGKINEYIPSVNNANWNNLNSLVENRQGEEIISNERFPLYVSSMDYLIGKELRDAGKSFTAFKQSKILQSKVMKNVFLAFEAKYDAYEEGDPTVTEQQYNEIFNIFQNKRDFTRAYLTATSYQTIKDFKIEEEVFSMSTSELAAMEEIREGYTEEDEDYDQSEDSDSKPERFDRTSNEDSAFSIADDTIQDFFRTIPKIKNISRNSDGSIANIEYELNELGFPENHKFYDVFYKTKKMLSGSFMLEDMQAKMKDPNNQRIFPELSIIDEFISKFIEGNPDEKNYYRRVQNVQFAQAFFNVMVMPEVSNMQLTMNYLPLTRTYTTFQPTMVAYRTASRNLSLKIIKTWEKNFKDRRGKNYLEFRTFAQNSKRAATEPLYLTEDGKLLLNPFVDYGAIYTNSLESVTNPNTRIKGLKDFWDLMGVTLNPKVFQDSNAVRELIQTKNELIKNIGIYRNSIITEWMEEARMTFSDVGIEANTNSLASIMEAMPSIMMDVFAKKMYISNPIAFFNEKASYNTQSKKDGMQINATQTTSPMRFVFEDLASLEEKFGERVSSGSFRIEDKTKYPYYIPNQLLIATELMNNVQRTTQFADNLYLQHLDPIKNNWVNRSYFMKQIFDTNGQRRNGQNNTPVRILVEDIASVRTITEDGIIEKSPRSLNRDEKFFMDVLTLFRAGAIEIPRAETSSTMFTIRLSDYGKGKYLPITVAESLSKGNSQIPEVFQGIVKQYFMAEIEKRQWFMKNDPTVKGANKQPLANQFNVFEGILPEELKKKVADNLDKSPEQIFAIKDIETDFRDAIEKYFVDQMNEVRPRFDALSKDQKEMLKDTAGSKSSGSMISFARAFVLNHFILSQEFYQLYYGDLYFYKNAFKRGKYVTNTGNAFFIDDTRNEMLNGIQNSTMASIYSGKKPGGKDFRFIKTSVMNDVEMKSKYVDQDDNKNMLLQGILATRLDSGALSPNTPEYAQFVADTKLNLAKYNSINIADGQGIIGMDFYRNFSIITNIWDEKKEKEYNRQKAIFRNQYDLYFTTDNNGNRVRMEGEELRQAREADIKLRNSKPSAYFNPLKISYTGPQAVNGPTRPVFDKFSVRPIIPEMAIGTRDESLMMEMAKDDIDYVKFKSGSKVYTDKAFDWFKKISDGEYNMSDFSVGEIPSNQLLSGYLKHQLSTEGFKEENIFGSQFRKIIFGIKYAKTVRNNANLVDYFTRLERQFKQTVDDLLAVEQNDLFSLLGVSEKNGVYRVSDMRKFLKLLQTESIKRGVAINNIDYIQYDEQTKNAKYPIDYAFNRQQIQDLLSGLIDERLRRLKVNGSSLIQVSSAGTERKNSFASSRRFKNATADDIRKYGTTGLHYYHMVYENGKPVYTSTMGVKVSLSGDYKSLLQLEAPLSLGVSDEVKKLENEILQIGQYALEDPQRTAGKIGYIQGPGNRLVALPEEEALNRLNQALKDPEWKAKHMKKLILIGYRIPTQNINFTDRMEIMEFLPESAGAIIIPPIELIVKSGSDFDIDKMNVMMPSLNDKGNIRRAPKEDLDYINKRINELTYEERDVKKIKKQLSDFLNGANIEIEELERIQSKIRMTMLNLGMKINASENFINEIIFRIQKRSNSIVPEKGNFLSMQDEDWKSDEEFDDMLLDFERVTNEYQIVDQQLQSLLANKEVAVKEKKDTDSQMKWFNMKRAYKTGRNNQLLDILSETMSHPYYFELLVTPSSAAMFEGFTNDLIASKENMSEEEYRKALRDSENKLFDRSLTAQQASTYGATAKAFDNLLSKRKDLGGYAIQRTFSDIFNFAKLSIAKEYSVKLGKDRWENKTIYTPLIKASDRDKSTVNGRILMHGDSVTGIPISKAFDELISLTVDLAGSPAYPYLGINNYNKKHVQYLLHQKVDPKSVVWFMNQPVLKELFDLYEKNRRNISGYTLKHAIVEKSLKMKILKNERMYETGTKMRYEVLEHTTTKATYDVDGTVLEPSFRTANPKKANQYLTKPYWDLHTQNLTESDSFSFEEMDEAIRNNDTTSDLQKKVLAYFASITEEADMLMKLQFSQNVDTTKYATLTSIMRNERNRAEVRDSGLFAEDQIHMIEKESMISPFDYTQKAKSILKILFPKLYTNRTIGVFSDLVNDVWGAKNVQIERISKIVENDYIEYIYKNYGTYQGNNLSDTFQPLLTNIEASQDHHFFAYELNALKAKYPELLDIPFVAGLYEDVYFPPENEVESYNDLDNMEIHNIFFLRNPDNPTFEKNIFTNNWRNLINFDPERLGLKETYTSQQIQEISDFFHKLIYFSLYQAGLTNTGNGFSDLIPYEHWSVFIDQAFDRYDQAKADNSNLEFEMLEEFKYRFRQMNPKVNWKSKKRVLNSVDQETGRPDEEPLLFFKNYYRGKDYRVTSDDLLIARTLFLRDSEKDDDSSAVSAASKPANQSPFAPGGYVDYKGERYILVKELSPGIWQLYDLIRNQKVATRVQNITTLNEKGAIVKYGQKEYLVTSDKKIIDLDKTKVVTWPSNDQNRKNILELAAKQQEPPAPPINPIGPEGQPPIGPEC